MNEGRVTANGIDFAYLEHGDGPLVLMLHGFPDNAHTWDRQMNALAEAGYHAVAPFMRGYHPTETPDGSYFDSATLATDARALIESFGDGPAFVVGHDWGAATTFYLCAAYPDIVKRAVALGLPHPIAIAPMLLDPDVVQRVFHFWFFQMQGLSDAAVAANDFAFIDYLYELWSPGLKDSDHVRSVKDTLAQPSGVANALGYYRAMFDPAKQDAALASVREAIVKPISVPTLSVIGANDLVPLENPDIQKPFFSAELRCESLDAGHFIHREQPDAISKMIVEWLAS